MPIKKREHKGKAVVIKEAASALIPKGLLGTVEPQTEIGTEMRRWPEEASTEAKE